MQLLGFSKPLFLISKLGYIIGNVLANVLLEVVILKIILDCTKPQVIHQCETQYNSVDLQACVTTCVCS